MKHILTYKIFESEFNDSFDTIRDYITALCDNLNLEDMGIKTERNFNKILEGTNGFIAYLFTNARHIPGQINNVGNSDQMEICMRIYRKDNEDEIKTNVDWLIERILETDVSMNNTGIKFILNNKSVSTWTQSDLIIIKFDLIKKIL